MEAPSIAAGSPLNSDSKNVYIFCETITSSGKQCTRAKTKMDENGVAYCTQHYKMRSNPTKSTVKETEPWDKLNLIDPFHANGSRVLQKIRSRLKAGPDKKKDGKGHIYIYHLAHERHLNYWKIGRTKQSVDTRMQQWQDEHKKRRVVLFRQYSVQYNKHVESLIHLYMAYCRMHRYPYKDGFHSVWALDPTEVIEDGQQIPKEDRDKHKTVAMHKHIEWFKCKEAELLQVVEQLCNKKFIPTYILSASHVGQYLVSGM